MYSSLLQHGSFETKMADPISSYQSVQEWSANEDNLLMQVDDISADQQRLEGEAAALRVQLGDETAHRQQEAFVAASAAAAAAEQAAELRAHNERLAEQNAQLEVGT